MYDYDGDDRNGHHRPQSRGRIKGHENGINHQQQHGGPSSEFVDDTQLEDDDDMW